MGIRWCMANSVRPHQYAEDRTLILWGSQSDQFEFALPHVAWIAWAHIRCASTAINMHRMRAMHWDASGINLQHEPLRFTSKGQSRFVWAAIALETYFGCWIRQLSDTFDSGKIWLSQGKYTDPNREYVGWQWFDIASTLLFQAVEAVVPSHMF